jgi:hypothetical protein
LQIRFIIIFLDNERSSPNYSAINNFSSPTHLPKRLVFPELNKLTTEELEFLNNNVDRQQEFLNDLPPIKDQNKLLDDLIVQVEELAGIIFFTVCIFKL